jgi:hypothetical protein
VRRDGDGAFVYVAGGANWQRRQVIVGSKENGMVEIRKGLSATDSVMVSPVLKDATVQANEAGSKTP